MDLNVIMLCPPWETTDAGSAGFIERECLRVLLEGCCCGGVTGWIVLSNKIPTLPQFTGLGGRYCGALLLDLTIRLEGVGVRLET